MSQTLTRPAVERPPGLLYALEDWPPFPRLALLGVQYAVMDAIYLVLVAIIIRSARLGASDSVNLMGIACVALAIGTALQALPRGPVGSGFLAPPVYSATYLAPSVLAAQLGGMSLVFGMTIAAGLMEVLIALLLVQLRVVVTPVLSGLSVFIVGLQLGVVGIGQMLDVRDEALPAFPLHLAVSTLTLAVCVGLSIWGRGPLRLLCTLLGLIAGMIAATSIHLIVPTGVAAIGHTEWVAMPHPALLQYRFRMEFLAAFLAAGVAAALRAVGVLTTCQRVNNAAWKQPDMRNIRAGVLADGLANVIGGALGAPGMSISPSLVGISSVTGATSRVIAFAASIVLLCIAVSPRLAGLFLLIPPEVAGPLLVFTASFMISGGMGIMLSRKVDARAVYVIGISTLLALSENVFPGYFRKLSPAVRSLTESPLAFGLMAAILLTLLFRAGTRQRADTEWSAATGSISAALEFLRNAAQGWKVPSDTIAKATAETQGILRFLEQIYPYNPGGVLRAWFDGDTFGVTLWSHGHHVPPLPANLAAPVPPDSEIQNEEDAVFLGLKDFLHGLAADRKTARRQRGQVKISLCYAT